MHGMLTIAVNDVSSTSTDAAIRTRANPRKEGHLAFIVTVPCTPRARYAFFIGTDDIRSIFMCVPPCLAILHILQDAGISSKPIQPIYPNPGSTIDK